jgi:signal peptide peptidase SppA
VTDSVLTVPPFRRIDEYCGLWHYEATRFVALWNTVAAADLPRHMSGPPPKPVSTIEILPVKGGRGVAVVKALGTLMKQQPSFGGTSTIQLRRDIRSAAANPDVGGILLAIDSPGGTVAGTADLAADVRAARRQKPVWAFIDDLGASAAYHVASQAGKIYANAPDALVGSIGTLWTVYDLSRAAEKEGVRPRVFATGPLKGAGVPGTEITEEQAAYFQRIVDQTQAHFDRAVRSGRGMSAAELAAVRSGGVWLAEEAVGLKLIDGIQSIDRVVAALAAER